MDSETDTIRSGCDPWIRDCSLHSILFHPQPQLLQLVWQLTFGKLIGTSLWSLHNYSSELW